MGWVQLWAFGAQHCWRNSEQPHKIHLRTVAPGLHPHWAEVAPWGFSALHFTGCISMLAEQPPQLWRKLRGSKAKKYCEKHLTMEPWQGAWKFPHGYTELRWAKGCGMAHKFASHKVIIFHLDHLRFIVPLRTLWSFSDLTALFYKWRTEIQRERDLPTICHRVPREVYCVSDSSPIKWDLFQHLSPQCVHSVLGAVWHM